jgi:hypothetical protein
LIARLAADDPALLFAILLSLALCTGGIYVFILTLLDARRTTITTAAELRKDAHTPERRRWLRRMQQKNRRAA